MGLLLGMNGTFLLLHLTAIPFFDSNQCNIFPILLILFFYLIVHHQYIAHHSKISLESPVVVLDFFIFGYILDLYLLTILFVQLES